MICPTCGHSRLLTLDHIIPLWLIRHMFDLGLRAGRYPEEYKEKICYDCNKKKAGTIQYYRPQVNKFMRRLALEILKKCDQANENKNQPTANASSSLQEQRMVEISRTETDVSSRIEAKLAGLRERVSNGSYRQTGQVEFTADEIAKFENDVRQAGL